MKFSPSTISFTLGAFLLHSTTVSAVACAPKHCLHALFPTGTPTAVSSALAFCSTYTTTINTATTGFPARATSACGTSPSRYSSACTCKPTPTTITTPTTPATPTCTPVVVPNSLIKTGVDYVLSYSVFFDACTQDTGFLGTMINHVPVYTYDACDFGLAAVGKFAPVSIPFTATAATEEVRLEFLIGRPGAVVNVDNVAVIPA